MCGIAGSHDSDKAFTLYQSNLPRGYYSSGSMALSYWGEGYRETNKILGKWTLPVVSSFAERSFPLKYVLYHSRGPTVETTSFVPENNHPFEYEDWVIAHNGIISNFGDLCKKYFPNEDFTGKTDSCIIPRLLSLKPTISEALEELKGTFALWMFKTSTRQLFLARSSSTLFGNFDTGDFCSTYFEGSVSLSEGIVYEIKDFSKITEISTFKTDSPYLIL